MSKTKGYISGCISSAAFGLIPLFSLPVMAKGIGHDTILFYRFFFAAFMLGLIMLFKKESFQIRKSEFVPLFILGLLYAVSALLLFWSYEYLAAGIAATILFLYPVFVTVIMAVFFHERISWITIFSILLAFAGVALLYRGDGEITLNPVGVAIILTAGLTFACYIIGVNKFNINNMTGTKLSFYAMAWSALFFLIKAQLSTGIQRLPDFISFADMILLALIPTVLSCITMVISVKHVGSTATSIMGAMEPVTAVFVGVLVFSEAFTSNLAIGILLIITAVTLIILSKRILQNLRWIRQIIMKVFIRI